MSKVRHIKYHPDEFLMGVAGMPPEQIGLYWLICSVIYSRGGPIPDDDAENARILRLDVRQYKRIKAALIERGKIRQEAGCLTNSRCEAELVKAHKRIEDAQAAGAQGGRPPTIASGDVADFPPTSPELLGEVSDTSAGSVGDVGDKSVHVLNGHNGLAKAAGFSGRNLTNNQEPITTKEEELPPSDKGGKTYAFIGKVIRLTVADFNDWQITFHGIADLRAELANYDAWFDENVTGAQRKKWFHRTRQRLNAIHQQRLAAQRQNGGASLNESF